MGVRRSVVRPLLVAGVLVAVVAVTAIALRPAPRPHPLAADGCPALHGRSSGMEDWADAFWWKGTNYWNLGDSATSLQLGSQLTTAGCNGADPVARTGKRIAPGPWPDRASTGLVPGTPVFAVRGVSVACSVAVPVAGRTKVYVAIDRDTGERKPGC